LWIKKWWCPWKLFIHFIIGSFLIASAISRIETCYGLHRHFKAKWWCHLRFNWSLDVSRNKHFIIHYFVTIIFYSVLFKIISRLCRFKNASWGKLPHHRIRNCRLKLVPGSPKFLPSALFFFDKKMEGGALKLCRENAQTSVGSIHCKDVEATRYEGTIRLTWWSMNDDDQWWSI
jgi:hypothetical protein